MCVCALYVSEFVSEVCECMFVVSALCVSECV